MNMSYIMNYEETIKLTVKLLSDNKKFKKLRSKYSDCSIVLNVNKICKDIPSNGVYYIAFDSFVSDGLLIKWYIVNEENDKSIEIRAGNFKTS